MVPSSIVSEHLADFSRSGSIEALIAEVADRHGRIDAVVDCSVGAPDGITGEFRETDPDAFSGLAEQSVVAFQRLAHASMPWLERNGGSLIAFVSDAGIFAAPRQSMIGAMRAATIGFVRNLALEVAAQNVRVHAISPGFVDGTAIAQRLEEASQQRMARARQRAGLGLPTPGDIAPLVIFLCGDGARRIIGQVISVNGGMNA
jgi:NAD(P)-dependent dehydrogenase (short-subunit alcohol dehydrogenase family)